MADHPTLRDWIAMHASEADIVPLPPDWIDSQHKVNAEDLL